MGRGRGPWIGQLGLRLALAFVLVAIAAVTTLILLSSLTTSLEVDQLVKRQQNDLANATARSVAYVYRSSGWQHKPLTPLTLLVDRVGAGMRVTDLAGHQVVASPAFSGLSPDSQRTRAIRVNHQLVGHVAVRFGDTGLDAAIARFEGERWPVRIGAAGIAALFALVVALLVSRRITAPVDRLIDSARARGRGEVPARAGEVRGFGEIQELAEAFDEMADAREEQDRVRRNLVADVAHELRTPIAILQAGHEAMLDGLAAPTSEQLASLRDEVLRLARMVDDLQRLASAEAAALQLTLAPNDLAAVAGAAADSLADTFDAAGITLERRLSEVTALCDARRVHEIVINLLTNAMKFTPVGGTVTLGTGPAGDGDGAVLAITDTGVGIPAEELPMVSERFFRGQRSSGIAGSGIGLTIVAELVRAHHGSIQISSEPGAGTQVTVLLPVPSGFVPDGAGRRAGERDRRARAAKPAGSDPAP